MKSPDSLFVKGKPPKRHDQWFDKISTYLCWTMTGLLAFLAGHSMGLPGGTSLAISGSGIADGLICQAIILCPATPLHWLLRAVIAVFLAIAL